MITLIWQSPSLDVEIETYEADTLKDAFEAWQEETENCTLIGALDGPVEILAWYP